jgi:hypothetical protein
MPAIQSDPVVNTSPLLALAAAGHLDVLRERFARVIVPYEVTQEIEVGGRTQFALEEFRSASWLDKRSAGIPVSPLLQSTLDPGEAAVVALATTEQIPIVAIDETGGNLLEPLSNTDFFNFQGLPIQNRAPATNYAGLFQTMPYCAQVCVDACPRQP